MPLSVGLMSLTTPASTAWESISPLVKFYVHLPKVCTHRDECKSCRKSDAALGTAAGENLFSPPMSYFPPLLSVSLFIPSYVPSLSLFLLRSFALGQRKALTPRLLPSLHCQLFFYFSWWGCGGGGGGWYREQESQSEKERMRRNYSVLPPSVSFLLHPPLAPSTLITLTFVFLSILPFSSCFSSYLRLSFLVDNADVRSCTHAGARTREDGITGAVDGKITNWISKRQ